MRTGRVLNDLRVKTFTIHDDETHRGGWMTKGGKRFRIIHGMSTRKYYDSSDPRYRIPAYRMQNIVTLTHLAIRFYNIKEQTSFGHVKVLKVVRSLSGAIGYRITFQAFSPSGVASVFVAKVIEEILRVEISSVRIKCSDSNHKAAEKSRQEQTLSDVSFNHVAPYISQYALSMYNVFTLNLKKEARHDISSVRVVKAMKHDAPSRKVAKGKKHDADGPTHLVTFEASLRHERKSIETFETKISVPTLFPTVIIDFKEIQIKND